VEGEEEVREPARVELRVDLLEDLPPERDLLLAVVEVPPPARSPGLGQEPAAEHEEAREVARDVDRIRRQELLRRRDRGSGRRELVPDDREARLRPAAEGERGALEIVVDEEADDDDRIERLPPVDRRAEEEEDLVEPVPADSEVDEAVAVGEIAVLEQRREAVSGLRRALRVRVAEKEDRPTAPKFGMTRGLAGSGKEIGRPPAHRIRSRDGTPRLGIEEEVLELPVDVLTSRVAVELGLAPFRPETAGETRVREEEEADPELRAEEREGEREQGDERGP
jgi:hypothetical protein